jgi:hypothetical protein
MSLYEETIRKAPMFKTMPKALVQEIAVHLTATTALPGDWIFCAGDIGHDMVFLGYGEVQVRTLSSQLHPSERQMNQGFQPA